MEGTVALTFVVEREDDQYVALCPQLDVASQGDSIEDAVAHLENAVLLYLDVIEEDGERERIFRERGIQIEERPEGNYRVDVHPGVFTTVRRIPIRAA